MASLLQASNELIQNGTALIISLTALVVAVAGLVAALVRVWTEINKLRSGLINANLELSRQSTAPLAAPPSADKHDPALVIQWAQKHKAGNPWDLGPKNWEKCLYDLGNPAGKNHALDYDENGRLKYQ